jgi:hypothetical protein
MALGAVLFVLLSLLWLLSSGWPLLPRAAAAPVSKTNSATLLPQACLPELR